MHQVILGFVLLSFLVPSVAGDCKCGNVREDDKTRWGGNQAVVVVGQRPYRQLYGQVEGGAGALPGVLVEVFANPEYLLGDPLKFNTEKQNRRRIAACLTAEDGRFCFRELKPGKYELRASLGPGWDVTQVYVVLDPAKGQKKPMKLTLVVGT